MLSNSSFDIVYPEFEIIRYPDSACLTEISTLTALNFKLSDTKALSIYSADLNALLYQEIANQSDFLSFGAIKG
jgi:hypothetical protein